MAIGVPQQGNISLSDGKKVTPLTSNAKVSKEGSYQLSLPGQQSGAAMMMASAVRMANVASLSIKNVKFVIDKTTPAAPTINTVLASSTTVSGKAEANSIIRLYLGGKYFRAVKASSKGVYISAIPQQKLGTEIKADAADAAGNISKTATVKVVHVPTINPISNLTTTITGKTLSYATLKVYVDGKYYKSGIADKAGNYKIGINKQKAGITIKVISTDKNNYVSLPVSTKVLDKIPPAAPTVNKVTYNSTYISGKGEKAAKVIVYAGTKQLATTAVKSDGTFKASIPKQKRGTYLKLCLVDNANNKSPFKTVKIE